MKFWVGLGSRSIPELRVGSGFSLGLKVWVGLGHKLGKILGLLWVKALVTLRFSGWVGSGFFGFFANSSKFLATFAQSCITDFYLKIIIGLGNLLRLLFTPLDQYQTYLAEL